MPVWAFLAALWLCSVLPTPCIRAHRARLPARSLVYGLSDVLLQAMLEPARDSVRYGVNMHVKAMLMQKQDSLCWEEP